mgnify:CR=1 FL=1
MSEMSELDLMMQTTEVKRVDYFPNGRGRRWLIIYQESDVHTWSIGLIEKPTNTASERHSYAVYTYDPPMLGGMSYPHWAGGYAGNSLKLLGHYKDFPRHDKVNDQLDDFSYPTYRSSPAFTMVRDVVIHMSGVNPPVS